MNKQFLAWSGVRCLGDLTILTRVSYLTLFLVPVVAFVWPYLSIGGRHLPIVLVLAYFAALSCLLGHLLYQIGVPRPVKDYSFEDYVGGIISRYRDAPNLEALEKAANDLRVNSFELIEGNFDDANELKILHESKKSTALQIAIEAWSNGKVHLACLVEGRIYKGCSEDFSKHVLNICRSVGASRGSSTVEVDLVRRSAGKSYQDMMCSRPLILAAATLFYLISIGLIIWMLARQCLGVLRSSGLL